MKYREAVMDHILAGIVYDLTHLEAATNLNPAQFRKWQQALAKEGKRINDWLGSKGWVTDSTAQQLEEYL